MSVVIFFRSLLVCLFFICNLILCNKNVFADVNKYSAKLTECRRCKLLTDSFNYWMEKTSRGKHEGGDTAWEEAKMKSYARSEIRLTEIQEGLCSELKKHQDSCYTTAEEADQIIEKWWFIEQSNSVDLFSWLCIETFRYCCPNNHFGVSCLPCLHDRNNNVCGGHGICDGDGTRQGNGTCLCHKGYKGKLCDECAEDFFSVDTDVCKPCHEACNGCSGEGAAACKSCKTGWQLVSNVCVDINECLDNMSPCKPYQYCENSEGSYICESCDKSCKTCFGKGQSNCSSCESDHVLLSGYCMDDKLKSDILRNILKRLALYCGLIIISIFILRKSKELATLTIAIIAVYVYFSEKYYEFRVFNVLTNLYIN